MSALDRKIKREVFKAAERWMEENLGALVRKEAGIDLPDGVPLKPHQFILRIQRELYRYGYETSAASAAGPRILDEFLANEQIGYGRLTPRRVDHIHQRLASAVTCLQRTATVAEPIRPALCRRTSTAHVGSSPAACGACRGGIRLWWTWGGVACGAWAIYSVIGL